MGKIKAIKGLGKAYEAARKEFLKGQENIYKLDKTGKKDKLIESMNKFLKDKNRKASPAMVDRYDRIMTSDFEKKTGPFFDKKGKE